MKEGSYPLFTNLIQASDGMLYGMTFKGGINDSGSIFQFDPAIHSFARKFDFDGSNGSKPLGSLIQASDGKLYGITYKGAGVYTINGVDKSRRQVIE